MSSSLPLGWSERKLIDCSINGISNGVFRDPKTVGRGYKLINVLDMYKSFGIDVDKTERLPLSDKEFEKNKVNYGDVFFTRSSLKLEGIAYCNINLSYDEDITYEGHLMRVVPNTSIVDPQYLARYCLADSARIFFMSSAKHSTMTTISQSDIAPLQVLLPPLPEQQKIAAILTSIDKGIESTQAQINKLKDLKIGMMQELLTTGIGHSEFKDSPVGRIPKAWEVAVLGSIGNWKGGGTPSKSNPLFWEGEIPWVSPKDMKREFITYTEDYVNHDAITNSSTNLVPKGSILIVTRSGILQHTLPVAIAGCDLTINQDLKAVHVKPTFCPTFIYHYLKAFNHKILRACLKAGNTVESLDFDEFSRYLIACPPLMEQQQISSAVESVAERIRIKDRQLNQCLVLKKALMQDLLTGKVRVKVS